MRHIAQAAEHMADGMAGPHGHAADDGQHGLPDADLAFQPRLHVGGVGLDARQAFDQQAQRAFGQTVAVIVGLETLQRLDRVIQRPHAGGKPQPVGRVPGQGGIKDHADRGHFAFLIALLVLGRGIRRP